MKKNYSAGDLIPEVLSKLRIRLTRHFFIFFETEIFLKSWPRNNTLKIT